MPNLLSRNIPMSKYFPGPNHFDITKFSCILIIFVIIIIIIITIIIIIVIIILLISIIINNTLLSLE